MCLIQKYFPEIGHGANTTLSVTVNRMTGTDADADSKRQLFQTVGADFRNLHTSNSDSRHVTDDVINRHARRATAHVRRTPPLPAAGRSTAGPKRRRLLGGA